MLIKRSAFTLALATCTLWHSVLASPVYIPPTLEKRQDGVSASWPLPLILHLGYNVQ